jgi:hypothetical protein
MYGMLLKFAGKAPEIAHESGLPNHTQLTKDRNRGGTLNRKAVFAGQGG